MRTLLKSAAILLCLSSCTAQVRREMQLDKGWEFSYEGGEWQEVAVPHDWAIAGPFDKKWDLQEVAVVQNGEETATEHSGRSGALPWLGRGVYKTVFTVPSAYRHAELLFDGAMSEPEVYVNGRLAGRWAYGYNAFRVDATPFLHPGGEPNELEVRLQNVGESSRWYPGGGLYRPVTLVLTGKARIDRWGTFIRTLSVEDGSASIQIDTQTEGAEQLRNSRTEISVYDGQGRLAGRYEATVGTKGASCFVFSVAEPELWSPEHPCLYKAVTRLYDGRRLVDETTDKFGIRTISFTRDGGFRLNGQTRKFKGVCLHHDLGPLGAAVNKAALIRQAKILKEMGCDAIRTAHNMPSTMQMEVCDSLGLMVMAESFDMWRYPKCKNGYARFFDEWSEKDLCNLVLNHRNHPSIVMWSIGNEIPEQSAGPEGVKMLRRLQDLCHELDPTRPVTQGLDRVDDALRTGFAGMMDIPALNYRTHKYEACHDTLAQGFLLGSETASTVSSRGVYKFPVEACAMREYEDGQCSGYDMEYCSWSNLPEDDFELQDDKDWTIGQFVWTGFDYLGEPTPYDQYWPSRSSYFGICDLAGLPKDRYYLYRSVWNTSSHTLHLLPHWTWPGREGAVVPVYCYTDWPEAELFVNGKSQGRIKKNPSSKFDRYRLRWNDVRYEPGELKVVAYDGDGKEAGQEIVRTAGAPHHLVLSPDRDLLAADGKDLAFVTVEMADADGNLCPAADDELHFSVEGEGRFEAACNGDATSLESFAAPQMRLFSGKLVVIVRSSGKSGNIRLRVTGDNGISGETLIQSK